MYRILYVDDEQDLLTLTRIFLEKNGEFQVDINQSATEILASGTLSTYDAVISDFQMPGMNGIEFLKAVREKLPDLPFLIFTGRGREEVVIEAINNGVDFYLQKGTDPNSQFAELMQKVKEAIHRRRAEKERRESEEMFSTVFRVSTNMEVIIDLKTGAIIDVNESFLAATGFTRDEVIGKTSLEAKIGATESESLLFLVKDLKPGGSIRDYNLPLLTKSGEKLNAKVNFEYLVISGRHLLFLQGIDIDILRRSETTLERFRFMVEKSADEIYLVNPDGDIEYVNKAAAQSLGYTVAELIGKSTSVFDPVFGPRFRNHFEEIKSHDLPPFETTHITKDGRNVIKEMRSVFLQDGDMEFVCGFARDITERKKTIELLHESEEKYRTLIENMQDGVFIAQDSVIQYVNEPYARLLGYRGEDIIGKPIGQFIAEKDLIMVLDRHKRRLNGELLPNQYDFHLIHRDGVTEILVSMNVSLIPFHGSMAALGTIRDVSQQRQAEKALRESEERYRTVFENTGTAMVIIESNTIILLANSQFSLLSGYPREEIEGKKSWTDFVAADDLEWMKKQHQIRREMNENALNTYEFRFISRYGELHYIMLTIDVIPGTSRSVASLLDITERKQIEENLTQVHSRLQLMNSITRHDIRNKASIISGYLTLMEDSGVSSEVAALIGPMHAAIGAIKGQVEFSKIYQDIGSKRPEWICILDILKMLQIPESTTLSIEIPELELYADPMLEKVFENLLDNSIRHGGDVHSIRVWADNRKDRLIVVWEDDGIGIPEDEKTVIFDRGYGKNTGLGLYLICNILAITGLTISETGEFGKGARFEISCYLGSYRIHRN